MTATAAGCAVSTDPARLDGAMRDTHGLYEGFGFALPKVPGRRMERPYPKVYSRP
jgi:hypothetical protein